MSKPELYPDRLPARFGPGTLARIDRATGGARLRADFIRRAVEEKLAAVNRPAVDRALEKFTAAVVVAEGERFRKAMLFGSHARGTPTSGSDVDVAVIVAEMPDGVFAETRRLAAIAADVLVETGVDIQPLPIAEDQFDQPERHANPRLIEAIHREGREI